ncbi:MAG: hypothetical protein KatS3mg076_2023 [Candidatus Binatia bacterium]|nr:MAG: hypothetical protein KatS3mg076_2023 [Candidatus Binatia bacterium]
MGKTAKRPDISLGRIASDGRSAASSYGGYESGPAFLVLLLLLCALHACNGNGAASSPADRAGSPSPTFTSVPQSPTATVTPTSLPGPSPTATPGPGDVVEGPALLTSLVLADLTTGTSRFARGGPFTSFAAVTRDFIYDDNNSTFSEILQIAPDTGEVVQRVRSPVQTKAMVASPDDRFLFVAWQDCPGNWMCRFPSGVTVYRIPELQEEVAAGFSVPGTVCRMLFVGETLLVVSAPAPQGDLPPDEGDAADAFVITLVGPSGDGQWNRIQRIVRGSLSHVNVQGLGPIDATGTCHVCCWS